jgi:hypothetical protein
MIQAVFLIDIDERQISEMDLRSAPPALLAEIQEFKPLYGRIRVSHSGAEFDVEDELWALIMSVCFRSIPELIAYRSVTIRYYSYNGYLRLDPEGGVIRISGDNIATVVLSEQELLPALFACGKRFLELSGRLGLADEISGDEPEIAAAEAILKQRGMI